MMRERGVRRRWRRSRTDYLERFVAYPPFLLAQWILADEIEDAVGMTK